MYTVFWILKLSGKRKAKDLLLLAECLSVLVSEIVFLQSSCKFGTKWAQDTVSPPYYNALKSTFKQMVFLCQQNSYL